MSKDAWFAHYERLQAEFEDEHGRMPTDAEDMDLADKAHGRLREQFADRADIEKKTQEGRMTHYMTLNRLDRNDTEVEVEYTISPLIPATWDDPAEGGEVEIVKVTCEHCGSEIKWTDAEDDKWCQHIGENHDHGDDGPDPDDARDRIMDRKLTEGL